MKMKQRVEPFMSALENFFEKYNITIPDENRTGESDEACLFGEAYYELEDILTKILTTDKHIISLTDAFYLCDIDMDTTVIIVDDGEKTMGTRTEIEEQFDSDDSVVYRIEKQADWFCFYGDMVVSEPKESYYEVDAFRCIGEVFSDGTSVMETLSSVKGILIAPYGSIYLPEDMVMKNTPLIQWLNERNLINPNPVKQPII